MSDMLSSEDDAAIRFANSVPGSAICTIIGIDGSFSRRLGAQLAIAPDGRTIGSLSDGCLESELVTQSRALKGKSAKVLRFGKGSPFIDFRLPCGSGLDVLIDASPDRTGMARVIAELDARRPATLDLPVEQPGLLTQRDYLPALKLLIFGTGPETEGLQKLAGEWGCDCQTINPKTDLKLCRNPSSLSCDPWTAIVLLFHEHEWEFPILDWALSTPALFIGAIGGHVARVNRSTLLNERGYSAQQVARIRSPIGLISKARSARVLALSVFAEIIEAYEELKS